MLGFAALLLAASALDRPELVVPALDGSEFRLSEMRGKVVLIDYWATWCPPCKEEMKALAALENRERKRGLEILALSTDRPRERDRVREAVKGMPFRAALQSDSKANNLGPPESIPMLYVIDRQGVIRAKLTPSDSPLSESDLLKTVEPLLLEKSGVGDRRDRKSD